MDISGSAYLNVPFATPFSWIFWWMGELGTELYLDIFAAILFSIRIDLIVIFLDGLLYLHQKCSRLQKKKFTHKFILP